MLKGPASGLGHIEGSQCEAVHSSVMQQSPALMGSDSALGSVA